MKNIIFSTAILFAFTVAAFGQKTDDKAAVLGVVNQLFAEMAAANPAGIIALNMPEAQLAALIKGKDGKKQTESINREQFSKFFTDKTAVIEELMYDPKVEVDGDWAMVWGRYIFFVSNKISHCGIDQFNLVRTTDGWKIANGASTIDPGACTEAEKSMMPRQAPKAVPPAQKGVSYNGASWSPDGKWITFTKMDIIDEKPAKIDADAYIVAADGTGLRRVTGDEANEFDPVFSKDGNSLFFSLNDVKAKTANIFIANIDGTGLRQLTKGLHHASAPQISRDGKWIAFNANLAADPSDHYPQIFVMKPDGTNVKQLTNDATLAFYDPVWSPNGKRLVYYVERGDRKDQIWSMKSDGTDQTLLTNNIGHNFYPSWTADGKKIIFTSKRDGKQQLYSMNTDGSDVRPLGIDGSFGRQSPDGKKFVYIGGQWPNLALYVSNADGSNPVKLII